MLNPHNGHPFDTAIAVETAAVRGGGGVRTDGLHSMPRRPFPHPIDRGVSR